MAGDPLNQLQEIIGYRFQNPLLLQEALTHSSRAQEASDHTRDNEQMEFLGDAILNYLVSVRLVDAFPGSQEGMLSRGRARLVAARHLTGVAANLNLGDYLFLGRGEEKTGGRAKAALLSDALEALVAALYRDGGLEAAENFVDRFVLPPDIHAAADDLFAIDYKSALQEYLQGERMAPGEYRVVDESGPEHQKTFTVEVKAGAHLVARGHGGSKKAAEQVAAKLALDRLVGRNENHG